MLEPETALLSRDVADFSQTCCPSAISHIRTSPSMRAATTPGSHCRVAGMSANTAQTSSGVASMSMVLLVPFQRYGRSSNRCDGALLADSSSVSAPPGQVTTATSSAAGWADTEMLLSAAVAGDAWHRSIRCQSRHHAVPTHDSPSRSSATMGPVGVSPEEPPCPALPRGIQL